MVGLLRDQVWYGYNYNAYTWRGVAWLEAKPGRVGYVILNLSCNYPIQSISQNQVKLESYTSRKQ